MPKKKFNSTCDTGCNRIQVQVKPLSITNGAKQIIVVSKVSITWLIWIVEDGWPLLVRVHVVVSKVGLLAAEPNEHRQQSNLTKEIFCSRNRLLKKTRYIFSRKSCISKKKKKRFCFCHLDRLGDEDGYEECGNHRHHPLVSLVSPELESIGHNHEGAADDAEHADDPAEHEKHGVPRLVVP